MSTTAVSSSAPSNSAVNAHLIWPILIRPVLSSIQRANPSAARTLVQALGNAENTDPGFLFELVQALLQDPRLSAASSMTECLLRAQGLINESEALASQQKSDVRISQLYARTFTLKNLLSRIPDQINQRNLFLQTIKEIASAIKKILDSMDQLTSSGNQHPNGSLGIKTAQSNDQKALEQRKRYLVKDSKAFSQALKCYFKGDLDQDLLFCSAVQLIYDLNVIEKVITKLSSNLK